MSATVRYPVGKAWVTVECDTVKDAIKAISEYAEVFCEGECGLCKGTDVSPCHRTSKGYDFYEMECLTCGARLSFGQTKEGGRLFPKRKDKDGVEIGKQGWHQYHYTQPESSDF